MIVDSKNSMLVKMGFDVVELRTIESSNYKIF